MTYLPFTHGNVGRALHGDGAAGRVIRHDHATRDSTRPITYEGYTMDSLLLVAGLYRLRELL